MIPITQTNQIVTNRRMWPSSVVNRVRPATTESCIKSRCSAQPLDSRDYNEKVVKVARQYHSLGEAPAC